MTRERLEQCASKTMPWAGESRKLKELKGKPLLTVLFQEPKHLDWVRCRARESNNFAWLATEIDMLLDAVASISPSAVCVGGKPVRYWSVLDNCITGLDIRCEDTDCDCYRTAAYPQPVYILHSFRDIMRYLPTQMEEKLYIAAFKQHYGLPKRYNFDAYLAWLLDNADCE